MKHFPGTAYFPIQNYSDSRILEKVVFLITSPNHIGLLAGSKVLKQTVAVLPHEIIKEVFKFIKIWNKSLWDKICSTYWL